MGAVGAEDLVNSDKLQGIMDGGEEKILVLVRLRPLSEKEIAKTEVADWECINSTTILYRNSLQERSGLPTAYSFDRVFRGDCKTREVYDEGIKDVALSVVGGINSTIFAYGQTSSGKTYTMNGVTEYTVADIYDYMQRHEERAFVLKFSAMEIYNEVVRDLLSTDSTPLRLLDDPERGTIIEKLTEETLRDWNHLRELLSICEAQRQVGETSLNETSSRSHQILRLTIESSAREFIGKGNSTTLSASVNFVDLAGSERASQALSVGQRLKEGCHINRSLLTLSTVIRKLSKGRHGHVNYRDSKLTRILQPALGGNARTAIICTLSPARSHVEQSRNTLLFASCAKEVSTNAQVNVVMSDKALVKQLQKEVARLENELKTPGSVCDHVPLLRKKDMQIEKVQQTQNTEVKNASDVTLDLTNDWPLKFEKLQKLIIELWQACSVSLVHRTYFILLVKDDLADSIYMEVEHRRLSFLKETFFRGNPAVQADCTLTLASSKKALRREREALSKLIYKRYTRDESNRIYKEWGISLNSKRRRSQLMNLLWSNTENTDHVKKSAAIVAKLIGFTEHGQSVKEMLGLSFTPPRVIRRSFGWKNSVASLLSE